MSGRYRLTESLPFRNGRGLTTYSDAVMRKEVAIVGVPRAKCASVSRTYQDRYFLPQVPAHPPSYVLARSSDSYPRSSPTLVRNVIDRSKMCKLWEHIYESYECLM